MKLYIQSKFRQDGVTDCIPWETWIKTPLERALTQKRGLFAQVHFPSGRRKSRAFPPSPCTVKSFHPFESKPLQDLFAFPLLSRGSLPGTGGVPGGGQRHWQKRVVSPDDRRGSPPLLRPPPRVAHGAPGGPGGGKIPATGGSFSPQLPREGALVPPDTATAAAARVNRGMPGGDLTGWSGCSRSFLSVLARLRFPTRNC